MRILKTRESRRSCGNSAAGSGNLVILALPVEFLDFCGRYMLPTCFLGCSLLAPML